MLIVYSYPMRNILFQYSSQQVHTGSPRVMMSLIDGLNRACYAPYFLTDNRGDLSRELEKQGTMIIQGKTTSIEKRSLPFNILNILNLIKLLRRHSIALVHINELGWNSELALAAFLIKVPVIFHLHNPETLNKSNINCRIGSKYLFVSNSLADQCNADSVLGRKAIIIYNPISIIKYAKGISLRSSLGIPDGASVVGSVAQISKRKGIDIFINTAAEILKTQPKTWFLVAGPDGTGEEDYAARMRSSVVERGLDKKIIFCGPMDNINNFLASIDIFFLPTRSEPFGMVFAEAMAAKVPVVASNVGGIPEIIPDESYGMTSALDNNDFQKIIITLLGDKNMRESIANKGYERVCSLFSDTIFNNKISQLYESVQANSRWV
jgi:glycosyltransferase involved in cell wall biosynthesis